MEIKKKYLMGLLALTVLIGVVSGAFIVRYIWQTEMSMQLVVSWELQLQYLNGTAISSYDWGQFNPDQQKDLVCQLNYTGNVNANVTWDTVNFPLGWFLQVYYNVTGTWVEWVNLVGFYLLMTPGQVHTLMIVMQEVDGVPNQPETFTLNFTASEYTP